MKRFKNIREMAQPKSPEEKRFKDQHSVEVLDPEGHGDDIKPKTKQKKRLADYVNGTDKAAYDKAYTVKKEEVDLDEGADEIHDRYKRSHGKKASGKSSNWIFTTKRSGDPDDTYQHKGNDTVQAAAAAARKHFGTKDVYVMEGADQLEEDIADIIVQTYGESLLEFTDEELDAIIDRLHEDMEG